jgi:hypothetical protein
MKKYKKYPIPTVPGFYGALLDGEPCVVEIVALWGDGVDTVLIPGQAESLAPGEVQWISDRLVLGEEER